MADWYRERPVQAVQWTGDNEAELKSFTGDNFGMVDPDEREEFDGATAAVLSDSSWVGVRVGQWVIKTGPDDFEPFDDEPFRARFHRVDTRADTSDPGELNDGLTAPAQPDLPELTEGDLKFLADLVGGTGDFVWGALARYHGMESRDVEAIYRKLTALTDDVGAQPAAARSEGCVDHMPTPNPDCEACAR
ncbi:MAG: hypothetical protein ACRDP6_37185 [Actinoallomurus sp.]